MDVMINGVSFVLEGEILDTFPLAFGRKIVVSKDKDSENATTEELCEAGKAFAGALFGHHTSTPFQKGFFEYIAQKVY